MQLRCDAVFEGGGVKGVGFAGAIVALEEAGYSFQNVAGTSAGAIAASLVAAGYTGREIERELIYADFDKFRGKSKLDFLGLPGMILNLTVRYGIYNANYFESWLSDLLDKKGIRTFADVRTGSNDPKYKYKVQAIASDLTDHMMLILPRDLALFGINPDDFEIARAVRMSMSIPFYYEPFKLRDIGGREHIVVDGGLLSNYPVWLLDDGTSNPDWPTFGLKFTGDGAQAGGCDICNIIDYSKALVGTMIDAGDNYHISTSRGDFQRSIMIPTIIGYGDSAKAIHTTDFDITPRESAMLAHNGRNAARKFLQEWDFESWKALYRHK